MTERAQLACPRCGEAAALDGHPVADGIEVTCRSCVSRFLVSEADRPAAPTTPAPPPRPRRTSPRPVAQAPAASRPAAPAQQAPTDPTVREAVEALLTSRDDVDPTALVLLGTLLGAATRLSALDTDKTRPKVEEWLDRTWGTAASAKRTAAVATVGLAFEHWHSRGWLSRDLRPHRD